MARHSVTVFWLFGSIAACGGEEPPPDLMVRGDWATNLRPLELAPGCWVPPPDIPVPEGVTLEQARVKERFADHFSRIADFCILRYKSILDYIETNDPRDQVWHLSFDTVQGQLQVKVLNETDELGPDLDQFYMRMETPATPPNSPQDPCMRGLPLSKVFGQWTSEESLIDQDGFQIIWNENSVAVVEVYSIVSFFLAVRGCDPAAKISYGLLTNYEDSRSIRCWDQGGQFVSCDGIEKRW